MAAGIHSEAAEKPKRSCVSRDRALTPIDSAFFLNGSRFTAHGSRPAAHGSRRAAHGSSGITLIELLVAMAIVALMVSIAYPSFTTGLDGIRLRTSLDRAGAFFHAAQQQADRRQQPVQFSVDPRANRLTAISVGENWQDHLDFTDGIHVTYPQGAVSYLLYPGSPPPQFRLLLAARQGARKGLKINIFTGVPEIWDGEGAADLSAR